MALVDNLIAVNDRLQTIPARLGVVTKRQVYVHRRDDTVYEITPIPDVRSVKNPLIGRFMGNPMSGHMGQQNLVIGKDAVTVTISRSNSEAIIYDEDVSYYEIEGTRYFPIYLDRNDNINYTVICNKQLDRY